ncbi:DEKNAAC103083 [Brettanomyces naardenensis]|uniref:DEKNAAC103083 n=1 Tax=Brettanomyces naardenensis TaxID=13370 RepID=A0A448YMG4_BRENA|nr:DEKNAAC103083 [Brettanomyces naardenensis]
MQALMRPTLRAVGLKQARFASASALSQASITHLEKRWEKLPEVDRDSLITSLSERQKLPWNQLSEQEKKAAYYVSFGEWGPRKPLYHEGEKRTIFYSVAIGFGVCFALYVGFRASRPSPKTMNKAWQEKSDEYLKSKHANPFHGYSQIQSK